MAAFIWLLLLLVILNWWGQQPITVVREMDPCPAIAEFEDVLPSELPEADGWIEPECFCESSFEEGYVVVWDYSVSAVGVTVGGLVIETEMTPNYASFSQEVEGQPLHRGETVVSELRRDPAALWLLILGDVVAGLIVYWLFSR